ncbi:hypothetical protein ABTZ98_02180 [Streptomyces bacillaris]
MTVAQALEKGGGGPHFTLRVEAFGETKPLSHWAVDPRARCAYNTLRRRLAQGWGAEQAITEEPQQRSTLGAGVPYRAFGLSMGLEDWARHTQIPAGDLRNRLNQHDLPMEAVLTHLGWTPHTAVRAEHDLIRASAADLRPGDHILGIEQSGADQPVFTVRRAPHTPPPQPTAPKAARAALAQTANAPTSPPPPRAAPSPSGPRR